MYVDYVGLRVTRLAPAVRFFEKGLGLNEVRRGKMGHGGVWVLMRDPISHQQIELNWYPKGSKYFREFVPGEGLDHLGIRVSDLPRAGRKIRAAGGRRVDEIRWKGKVVIAYYEGPDGIWVELIDSPTL
ncbi:MAG TPA: VOC family protein [Thermoplasmata archaeon]|nr:VOC family protein [Thermoplasmata archaeon]